MQGMNKGSNLGNGWKHNSMKTTSDHYAFIPKNDDESAVSKWGTQSRHVCRFDCGKNK